MNLYLSRDWESLVVVDYVAVAFLNGNESVHSWQEVVCSLSMGCQQVYGSTSNGSEEEVGVGATANKIKSSPHT